MRTMLIWDCMYHENSWLDHTSHEKRSEGNNTSHYNFDSIIRNNDDIDFVTLAVFLLNYDVRDNWFFPVRFFSWSEGLYGWIHMKIFDPFQLSPLPTSPLPVKLSIILLFDLSHCKCVDIPGTGENYIHIFTLIAILRMITISLTCDFGVSIYRPMLQT